MTVRRLGPDAVALEGDCALEDADHLLQALLETPGAVVDWQDCRSIHTAVIQVLMATKAVLRGAPADPFLTQFVAPALSRLAD